MHKNGKKAISNYEEYIFSYSPESISRLGIGYILQCNKGDSFGMVYGYRDHGRTRSVGGKWTWIYHFKKKKNIVMNQFSPVSFLKSSSGYSINESSEVSNVMLLSKYTIIDVKGVRVNYEKKGEDGHYHSDIEWNLMRKVEPYIIYGSVSNIDVYYPIENVSDKTVVFHKYVSYGTKGENIISCFIGMRDLRIYSTEPKLEHITSKLDEIKKYVTSFNVSLSIKTFIAGQNGHFKSYTGKDDSFFITNYWRTTSNDLYIKQLVNLHEDMIYYNCQGQGKDEEDYDRINIEETKKLRAEVKQKYNRGNHYIFLVKEFFEELHEQRELYLLYQKNIFHFIEKGDDELFENKYVENSYINFIEKYNRKHECNCFF